jgi:hypothetical protein
VTLKKITLTSGEDIFVEETSVDTTFVTDAKVIHRGQADQTNFENVQRVFNDALAAVKVSEAKRDINQNQRLRYELNWTKLRSAAQNYAEVAGPRGIKVLVPKYHAPLSTTASYVEFKPVVQDGRYEETGGAKSGLGLPGSATPAERS